LPCSTQSDIGIFASAAPVMFLKLIAFFLGNILDYADKNTWCKNLYRRHKRSEEEAKPLF
jgi:hypothetical protein